MFRRTASSTGTTRTTWKLPQNVTDLVLQFVFYEQEVTEAELGKELFDLCTDECANCKKMKIFTPIKNIFKAQCTNSKCRLGRCPRQGFTQCIHGIHSQEYK